MKIFVASTGRCGTMFMSEVFRELTGIPSYHEPLPYCIGKTLEETNDRETYSKETKDELTRKIQQVKECSLDGDYFESNQMFIKSYAELMVRAFRRISVIYLERNPIEVALSYAEKCEYYEADWVLRSHWRKNMLPTSVSLSFFETIVWQYLEVKERYLRMRKDFSMTFEFDFRKINDGAEWDRMFSRFGIKHKPFEELPDVRRNQGEKPMAERLEKVRADWYKEPAMKTVGNPGYFDVNERTEAFLRSRAMHFARTNRCSLM